MFILGGIVATLVVPTGLSGRIQTILRRKVGELIKGGRGR